MKLVKIMPELKTGKRIAAFAGKEMNRTMNCSIQPLQLTNSLNK